MTVRINNGPLAFNASIDEVDFNKSLSSMNQKLNSFSKNVAAQTAMMDELVKKAAGFAATYFSIDAAQGFVSELINVRGQYQQIEAAYRTMLGSKEKADKLMAQSIELAAKTPFGLQEVASGSKQLLAYGFAAETITDNLVKLGNVASGVGSQLSDIVYLYGTLKASGRVTQMDINQFAGRGIPIYEELAKVMQTNVSEVRNMVSAGKVGFPQVEAAFNNMTAAGGKFYNLMQEQSKSLTGQISNLEDTWEQMLNKIGKSQEGLLSEGIQGITILIEHYETIINIIGVLVLAYGAYRAALIATAIQQRIVAEGNLQMALSGNTLAASQIRAAGVMALFRQGLFSIRAAMIALTSTTSLVTIGITAITTVLYALASANDTAEEAQKRFLDIQSQSKQRAMEEEEKIKTLVSIAKDRTSSLDEQAAAIKKLNDLNPEFLNGLSQANINTAEGSKLIKLYLMDLEKKAQGELAYAAKMENNRKIIDLQTKGSDALGTWEGIGRSIKNTFTGKFRSSEGAEKLVVEQAIKELKDANAKIDKAYGEDIKKYQLKNSGVSVAGDKAKKSNVRTEDVIDEEIKQLKEKRKQYDIHSKEYAAYTKKINKLQDELAKAQGKLDKAQDDAIEKRKAALRSLDDLESDVYSRSLSRAEQQIFDTRRKFQALREELREAGIKDPKVYERVNRAEKSETGSIKYDDDTEKLRKKLNNQMELYKTYEDFKTTYGKQAADIRFKNEVNTSNTMLERLQTQLVLTQAEGFANGFTGAVKDRMLMISEFIKNLKKSQADQQLQDYKIALESSKTFEQKAIDIDVEYNKKKEVLGKDATAAQLLNLSKERDAKIRALNEENAYAKSGYAELMADMLGMTKKAVLERLNVIKKGYQDNKNLTPEQKQNLIGPINDQIDRLSNNTSFDRVNFKWKEYKRLVSEAKERTIEVEQAYSDFAESVAQNAQDVSAVLSSIGNALHELGIGGDGLQDTLKNIQGVIGGIGNIAKGIASGNPVDIVTGSINLLTSAINLFNTKDKKLQKKIDQYKANLASLEQQYAQLDRAVQNSVGENYYSDSAKQIENLKRQQQELIRMRNAEASKKKADKDKISEYDKQISEIPNKIADIEKAISEQLIQGTFKDLSNSLADALVSAFQAGEDGLAAMDKSFNQFIANAIKNSLKLKLIEPIVASLTEDLVKYAKNNKNSIAGFDFNEYKKQLDEAGKLFNQGLEQTKEFFQDTADASKKEGLSKGIQGVTETTANRLEAEIGGLRLAQLQANMIWLNIETLIVQQNQISQLKLSQLIEIQKNTLRTANNTDKLDSIDKSLSNMNKKIDDVDALKRGGGIR